MYSLMSSRIIERSSSKSSSGSVAPAGLPDTGGPEEDERADWPVGIGETSATAAHRVGDRADGVLLPDDHARASCSMRSSFLHLALEHLVERDADHLEATAATSFADLLLEERAVALHLDEARLLLLERALQFVELAITELGGATASRTIWLGAIRLVGTLPIRSLMSRMADSAPFSCSQRVRSSATALLQVGELALEPVEAILRSLVRFLAQRLTLDLELANLALDDVQLGGSESISMRNFDAASSIRSIALSGRRSLSVM